LYLSNCEEPGCGVGAITFNSAGQVIKYEMALEETDNNCGGGPTYWGTWVTCEEDGDSGFVWEVEPGKPANQQQSGPTQIVVDGGNYESFAYDARDRLNPTFYVTEDSSDGALTRFTPNSAVVQQAESSGDYSEVLRTAGSHHW
jgi:secreted PhoX family phosphatase